ncbi:MAG TPA: hypothetical protein DCP36_15700 [Sporomusaceae bacterium]|nr:hypothetical protein [Sporomusaceae bacterium]
MMCNRTYSYEESKVNYVESKQNLIGSASSLRINSIWRLIGQIIYLACQWGMLVVLAKLGSPEMVGQYALGLAISAPVILFFNLQLRIVQSTDVRNEYIFSESFILRIVLGITAVVFIFLTAIVFEYTISTIYIVIGIALCKVIESISEIIHGYFQKYEQMKLVAYSLIAKGVFALAFLFSGIFITHTLIGGVIGIICGWTITLFLDMSNCVKLNRNICSEKNKGVSFFLDPFLQLTRAKTLVLLTFPLGLVTMLSSFISNVPRYFISYYFGERELGLFSAVSYFMMFGALISSAFGETIAPRLAKYYLEKDNKKFTYLLMIVLIVGSAIWLVGLIITILKGPDILALIYAPEYSKYSIIMIWIIFAAGLEFIASIIRYAIMATKFYIGQTPLFLSLAVIAVLLCIILIPLYGVTGACIAINFTMLVQIVGSIIILYRIFNKR